MESGLSYCHVYNSPKDVQAHDNAMEPAVFEEPTLARLGNLCMI